MGALPELELHAGARVIADLHLDLGDPQSVAPFLGFLAGLKDCPELVVLGDLFDVWVGPAQMSQGEAPRVLGALAHLEKQGTKLVVVHGNRDFLLEHKFAERVWGTLLPDGFVAKLPDGSRMLCVHGDTLCTKDKGYQRLRRVLRSRPMLWLAPRLPYWFSRLVAKRLRRASVRAIAAKLPDEKSIQREAVASAAKEYRASIVLCGHAHSFRDEQVGRVRWFVLDAFGGAQDEAHIESTGPAVRGSDSRRVGAAPS